jgi:hypothetical protein
MRMISNENDSKTLSMQTSVIDAAVVSRRKDCK